MVVGTNVVTMLPQLEGQHVAAAAAGGGIVVVVGIDRMVVVVDVVKVTVPPRRKAVEAEGGNSVGTNLVAGQTIPLLLREAYTSSSDCYNTLVPVLVPVLVLVRIRSPPPPPAAGWSASPPQVMEQDTPPPPQIDVMGADTQSPMVVGGYTSWWSY